MIREGVTYDAGHALASFACRDQVMREQVRSDFPTHVQNGDGTDLLLIPDGVDVVFHWPDGLR